MLGDWTTRQFAVGPPVDPPDDGIDWDSLRERWISEHVRSAVEAIIDHCMQWVPADGPDIKIRGVLAVAIWRLDEGDICAWAANLDNSSAVPAFDTWAEKVLESEGERPDPDPHDE